MSFSDVARPRAFWADARFLIGILLTVAAVTGVWLVVAAARQTVPVLVADRVIVSGQTVSGDDLRVVEVALGSLEDRYAQPGTLAPGAVAMRTLPEGELIPADALGTPEDARTTVVVVRSATPVPDAIGRGAEVEVWHAPRDEEGGFGEPRILLVEAIVSAVREDDGVMGQAAVSIELVVDRTEVAVTLAALAAEDSLSVIPTAGP